MLVESSSMLIFLGEGMIKVKAIKKSRAAFEGRAEPPETGGIMIPFTSVYECIAFTDYKSILFLSIRKGDCRMDFGINLGLKTYTPYGPVWRTMTEQN